MAKGLTDSQNYTDIAAAIRAKKGTSETLTPGQMAAAIDSIESGLPSAAGITFGYVKKTETVTEQAPEGKCWYNGVLLPEIPADVLASYQICLIYLRDDGTNYRLLAGTKTWYVSSSTIYLESSTYVVYGATAESDSWVYETQYTDNGNFGIGNGIKWSNHDIPNGSATATAIYFKGSEPLAELTETITNHVPVERESNYSITSESLNNIAKRTQEMAGTSKLLTLDDIIYWLGRVMFIPQGRSISEFSLAPLVFESAASARLPEVVKAAANSEFSLASLAFESSAVGALSE